jgi:segregation and condensation protein B
MSLKAKIEAVIYASEEPVTLAQLTGLLGQEAQAELDHLDSAQHRLALEGGSDEGGFGESADSVGASLDVGNVDVRDEDELNSEVLSEDLREDEAVEGVESEAEHAEAVERHLHEAAAAEAEHAREAREHAAADEAAMTSADAEELDAETPDGASLLSEGSVGEESVSKEDKGETGIDGQGDAGVSGDGEGVEAEAQGESVAEVVVDEKRLAREAKEKDRRLREYFRSILDQLIADYATSERGLEIREVAGGYRLATKPEYHDAVRGFVKSLKPPLKLSLQALETLAVVAYKQPVTAPEISEIRGVDSGGVLGSLMARKLITTAGRKQVIGRPILYKTTRDFLLRFGLKDINELPSIEEFEKMAGELAEQEEIPMEHHAPESSEQVEQEKDETEPQADGDSSSVDSGTEEDVADEVIVDGRISGLPPNYETGEERDGDSPARDAEIQAEIQAEEGK